MRRFFTLLLGAVAVVSVAPYRTAGATPTLIGETVGLEHVNFGTTGVFAGITFDSAIVGDGIEFDTAVEPEIVDVGASDITYSSVGSGALFGPTELDRIILTFGGDTIIVGADLVAGHGVGNLTQSAITFGDHSVSLLLAGLEWELTDVASVNLTLVDAPIPEPSSLALFGIGALVVGVALRRRGASLGVAP